MAQREEIIRRTVYVSDIDQQVYSLICFHFLPLSVLVSYMLFVCIISFFLLVANALDLSLFHFPWS